MEKHPYGFPLIFSLLPPLGILSFSLCIASEFKKSKRQDLRLDGKLCYLPGSDAFGFGIAALISLSIAQIVGTIVICRGDCSGQEKARKHTIPNVLLLVSWVSFGISALLLGAASSMSRTQPFGRGWLDGECYMVKDGVYAGSGVLVLVTICSTLFSGIRVVRKGHVEQRLVHAQSQVEQKEMR